MKSVETVVEVNERMKTESLKKISGVKETKKP